jgi:hypothetical protein
MMSNASNQPMMSNASNLSYQAAIPPAGTTCHGNRCGSGAVVRLIVPRPKISGHNDDAPLAVWDLCGLHWPTFRRTCERSGHQVIDTTGDLRALQDEFPRWNVWASDEGRLYAATHLTGPDGPRGITVDAVLAGQLRAAMHAVDARELHHV